MGATCQHEMGVMMIKSRRLLAATCISSLAMAMPSAPVHAQASDPYLGQLLPVGFNFCPRGWTTTDGQLLSISSNTALFSLLGTIYGGNGVTTFALPDLRGRAPIGQGYGAGLTAVPLGSRGGTETVTLTAATMPAHTHTAALRAYSANGNTNSPVRNYIAKSGGGDLDFFSGATPTETMAADAIELSSAGGSQPFNNRDPYLGTQWCIALQGIFPSRN